MKIGVIGATAGIANKAYLSIYAQLQNHHEFIIYSRNLAKVQAINQHYYFSRASSTLKDLENCNLVMIHAATSEHYRLAHQFLNLGIHVFMDKPISESFDETQKLIQLADEKNCLFMIGFNRRFAPLTQKLKKVPNKNVVSITKNLADNAAAIQYTLYDIFIHPLDTLIYLLDADILDCKYRLFEDEGKIKQILVTLQTEATIGLAAMNLESGAYTETFKVESLSGTYLADELEHFYSTQKNQTQIENFNGWTSISVRRGFYDMIVRTFEAVESFNGKNREELQHQLLQDNVIQSHAIINYILEEHKSGK